MVSIVFCHVCICSQYILLIAMRRNVHMIMLLSCCDVVV
jgi:hypothetical protein